MHSCIPLTRKELAKAKEKAKTKEKEKAKEKIRTPAVKAQSQGTQTPEVMLQEEHLLHPDKHLVKRRQGKLRTEIPIDPRVEIGKPREHALEVQNAIFGMSDFVISSRTEVALCQRTTAATGTRSTRSWLSPPRPK